MNSSVYTHNIFGKIVSADSLTPLDKVEVLLLNDDDSPADIKSYSNSNGNYELLKVPDGNRKIIISKSNYQQVISTIALNGENYKHDVQLFKKPGYPFNPSPENNIKNVSYYQTLSWDCDDPAGDPITYDVYLGKNSNPEQKIVSDLDKDKVENLLLEINTDYYWKVVAKDNKGNESTSPVWFFKTKNYNSVQIDNQEFLVKNLNVGAMITSNSISKDNGIVEKYCYEDNLVNCELYGGLYNWDETIQYDLTPGAQGICPEGWHIPTYDEFLGLKNAVNGNGNALKAIGEGYGDGAGTNTSGFSALLAGGRDTTGYFHRLGNTTYFWSSSSFEDELPYYFYVYDASPSVFIPTGHREWGASVRCIKN